MVTVGGFTFVTINILALLFSTFGPTRIHGTNGTTADIKLSGYMQPRR